MQLLLLLLYNPALSFQLAQKIEKMMKKNFFFDKQKSLYECVEDVLRIKEHTTRGSSPDNYAGKYQDFKEWLRANDLDEISTKEFTERMAGAYMEHVWLKEKRNGKNLVNITKNNYLNYVSGIFNVLVAKGECDVNPFNRMKKLKVVKEIPKAYTKENQDLILNYLYNNDRRMYFACCFLYYGFIRPKELASVQVSDIDLKKRTITLKKEVTKTEKERIIRITDPLLHILVEMRIGEHNLNAYLFGRLLLTTDVEMYRADFFSKRWAQSRRKLRLPKHFKFYNWKHTGIQDHHRAGITIAQLSRQSGLSVPVLQEYLENNFPAEDEFIENSPYLSTIEKKYAPTLTVDRLEAQFHNLSDIQQKMLLQRLNGKSTTVYRRLEQNNEVHTA